MSKKLLLPLVLIVGAAVAWGIAYVVHYEPPRNDDYEFVQVTEALVRPVYLTHAGDDRLFLVEKAGQVRIWQDDQLQDAPFLDITERVKSDGNEQGLLSIAFSPDYDASGLFYVYYNDAAGSSIIERGRVSSDDPNRADPAAAEVIMDVEQPYGNHNGGLLKFGPDGYLYIGLGDGGSAGDPQGYGQDRTLLLGNILRIDVNDPSLPYRIPADNPFVDDPDARPEIWAYGLRNPWRFSFDRDNGDLYIADVGQSAEEEINFQAAGDPGGQNYGWNIFEGDAEFASVEGVNRADVVFPVATYEHGNPLDPRNAHCSVTGGYVYRGDALPEIAGKYLYGDWCSGTIWTLARDGDHWQSKVFMNTSFNISSFGEGADGTLYLLSFDRTLWRLAQR